MAMPWFTSNNPRFGKRTTANGIQLTVGNAAGVLSPFLFTGSGPVYTEGYAVAIGLLGLSGSLFTGMHFYWKGRNAKKRAGKEDWRVEGMSEDEVRMFDLFLCVRANFVFLGQRDGRQESELLLYNIVNHC